MKKVIIILSAFLLMFSVSTHAADKVSDWAAADVETAVSGGIIKTEIADYTISASRSFIAELMFNTLDSFGRVGQITKEAAFSDCIDPAVTYLFNQKLILGKGNSLFCPDDTLTREEASALILRLAGYLKAELPYDDIVVPYEDDGEISDWAKDGVYYLQRTSLMLGTDENKFLPKENCTIEQATSMVMRVAEYTKKVQPTDFDDDLFELMPKNKSFMYSPLSIKTAMALAATGANGDTEREITDATGIGDINEFGRHMVDLSNAYSDNTVLALNMANSIWINSDKTEKRFSEYYKNLTDIYYGAEPREVSSKNAVKEINSWVSDKTNGKIPNIISSPDFEAYLLNAVYFKGTWANPFAKGLTEKDSFTDCTGEQISIDFMHDTGYYSYAKSEDAAILKLPYKNYTFSNDKRISYDFDVNMYVILPSKDKTVQNPSSLLADADFTGKYIRLSFPKFKTEFSTSLNDILGELGIKTAFSDLADFTKMFDGGTMQITDTIHKTYISVDEEGTEATAATGIGMATTALPPTPIEFKCDRPFVYIIRDDKNGETLFVGMFNTND